MTGSSQILLVLTNFPNDTSARELAEMLVDRRLAACINILQGCTSVYRWQGLTETASEVPVLIKTTRQRYEAVEQAIKSLHPYELPEIIAVPVDNGLPAYLQWIAHETTETDT
ncbi:MAG TPA: divalent-cation tolerance protein CutA [Nitrosomonas europaea]|uniref:divalent-cation tolerance protein CutA n=1 Tax=Nitrosomonas TaxID=914 RepID=UPI0023F1B1AF|nr:MULTISPECIES: divalent-cation tolerance protein CutA [Nitrosomonas]MCE7917589.1 divalent-cation tolerance protein CutA [Nitrosomonas sp. PRO5]MEB2330847.1 divalent-cation tolerance protein CutA [Nitrosomonas sp.]HRN81199.1 divalent-cation tolerance protein CutA [Nitrosomonas europaea]HRO56156.1 divalent-cation tolerance protein CutA [Nitrosomonas europaea]HRQ07724.1 divalent-cation tolerance protein CutA [Nitrosomonas europaea]